MKIADRWGCAAVSEFTEVELARNEQEEKEIKKITKEAEQKKGTGSRAGSVSPGTRYISCYERAAVYNPLFLGEKQGEQLTRKFDTTARGAGTSPGTAKQQKSREEALEEEEEKEREVVEDKDVEEKERAGTGDEDTSCIIFNKNKMTKNNDFPGILSIEAFDRVEDNTFDRDFSEHLTGDAVDITEGEIKMINALRGKNHLKITKSSASPKWPSC